MRPRIQKLIKFLLFSAVLSVVLSVTQASASAVPSSSLTNVTENTDHNLEETHRAYSKFYPSEITRMYIKVVRKSLETIFGFKCTDQEYEMLSQFPECSLTHMDDLQRGLSRGLFSGRSVCRPWKNIKTCFQPMYKGIGQCLRRYMPLSRGQMDQTTRMVDDIWSLGELVVCPGSERFTHARELWCKYFWPCKKNAGQSQSQSSHQIEEVDAESEFDATSELPIEYEDDAHNEIIRRSLKI